MKPVIRKKGEVWICSSEMWMGIGINVEHAYANWASITGWGHGLYG